MNEEMQKKIENMTPEEIAADAEALGSLMPNIARGRAAAYIEAQGKKIVYAENGGAMGYMFLVKDGEAVKLETVFVGMGETVNEKGEPALPNLYLQTYTEAELSEIKMPIFCPPDFLQLLDPTDDPEAQRFREKSAEAYPTLNEYYATPEGKANLAGMQERIEEA